MTRYLMITLILLIVISSVTGVEGVSYAGNEVKDPEAVAGRINLTAVKFDSEKIVDLNGKWEFYWNKHLTSKELQEKKITPSALMEFGNWKDKTVNGEKLPLFGFATYRLRVAINDNSKMYGLYLQSCISACKLFVDGTEVASIGTVGVDKDSSVPGGHGAHHIFKANKSEVELILHVSNFNNMTETLVRQIEFGSGEAIRNTASKAIMVDALIIGTIFIMGIYHLVLFLFRNRAKSALLFGLFCMLIAVRFGVSSNSNLLHLLYKNISWSLFSKVTSVTFFIPVALFTQFVYTLFSDEHKKYVYRFVWVVAASFSLLILFVTPIVHFQLVSIFNYLAIFLMVILSWGLIKSCFFGREGSYTFMFGFLLVSGAVFHDILVFMGHFEQSIWGHYGVLLLILAQSFLLARKYSRAFTQLSIATQDNEHLKELDKQKTHFFQNISHELRTPLTLIMNPLEELKVIYEDNVHIEMAQKNARRLFRLVNQLLDYQKLSSQKMSLKLQPIDLKGFLKRSGEYFRSSCENNDIRFQLAVDTTQDVYILGQVDALEKIVFNYLSNALKHTSKGGYVALVLSCEDGKAKIIVKDSGAGISHEDQDKLFKVFSQLDECSTRHYEGTGLGLALVKELAQEMNGKVGVISEEGIGSSFWAEFDISLEQSRKAVDVLYVDDSVESLHLFEQIITEHAPLVKYIVTESATTARKYVESHAIKCVLSDENMPDERGIDFLNYIRTAQPKAKRILMTADKDIDVLEEAVNVSKIDHVVYKPIVDHQDFVRLVENSIGESNSNEIKTPFDLGDYIPKKWLVAGGTSKKNNEGQLGEVEEDENALILVVDDIKDMRDLIRNSLKKDKYSIIQADDGVSALEVLKNHKPSLIITDWMMPKMSGIDLIAEINKDSVLSTIPTVLLTAKSDEDSKQLGNSAGASAYIGKPFDELELLTTVSNLLKLKKRENEVEQLNMDMSSSILSRYLPEELIKDILAGKATVDDSPQMKYLTVVNFDLFNFGEYFSEVSAKKMSKIINNYLSEMNKVVFESGGIVDKFTGDAITAIFGALGEVEPVDQIRMALDCIEKAKNVLAALNPKWKKEGLPEFKIRAGIHHDLSFVGHFGSKEKSDYTVVGNAAIFSLKIKDTAVNGEVLFSKPVLDLVVDHEYEVADKIGYRDQSISLYRLLEKSKKAA